MLYHSRSGQPGICDRCGRRCELGDMRAEIVRGKTMGNSICPECFDEDHPQNWVGSVPVSDRQNIIDAQPEPNRTDDLTLYGFDPVGAYYGNKLFLRSGIVTVTVS